MRHLVGMKNIQMYEFTGDSLDKVLAEAALFVAKHETTTWDLKQEWRVSEETGDGEFVLYLFGCDA